MEKENQVIFLKNFEIIKKIAEEKYNDFGEIFCPYLQCKVIFNAKGREHLKFKSKHKARSHQDQWIRFKLLKLAPEVIKLSRTLQGVSKTKSFELRRSNQRNEMILMNVVYYEFIAIVEERVRVRVIVKQIENSQPYFWSVIPFWKKDSKKNIGRCIKYGNPEED